MKDSKPSRKLINMEELKKKLVRGDNFILVNAFGEWAFDAKHIPGSINISKYRTQGIIIILILMMGIELYVLQTTYVLVTNCN
jgi:hypothetical protein